MSIQGHGLLGTAAAAALGLGAAWVYGDPEQVIQVSKAILVAAGSTFLTLNYHNLQDRVTAWWNPPILTPPSEARRESVNTTTVAPPRVPPTRLRLFNQVLKDLKQRALEMGAERGPTNDAFRTHFPGLSVEISDDVEPSSRSFAELFAEAKEMSPAEFKSAVENLKLWAQQHVPDPRPLSTSTPEEAFLSLIANHTETRIALKQTLSQAPRKEELIEQFRVFEQSHTGHAMTREMLEPVLEYYLPVYHSAILELLDKAIGSPEYRRTCEEQFGALEVKLEAFRKSVDHFSSALFPSVQESPFDIGIMRETPPAILHKLALNWAEAAGFERRSWSTLSREASSIAHFIRAQVILPTGRHLMIDVTRNEAELTEIRDLSSFDVKGLRYRLTSFIVTSMSDQYVTCLRYPSGICYLLEAGQPPLPISEDDFQKRARIASLLAYEKEERSPYRSRAAQLANAAAASATAAAAAASMSPSSESSTSGMSVSSSEDFVLVGSEATAEVVPPPAYSSSMNLAVLRAQQRTLELEQRIQEAAVPPPASPQPQQEEGIMNRFWRFMGYGPQERPQTTEVVGDATRFD